MRRATSAAAAILGLAISACGGTAVEGTGGAASGSATGEGGGATSTGTGGATTTGTATGGGTTATGVGGGPSACTDPSAKACSGAGQCTLATPDCCLCGMPELSDYVPMSKSHAAECACEGPVCDCVSLINPNLASTCEAGSCVAWDVRKEDAYSACQTAADCKLRMGLDCCEACQGTEEMLVAVRTDAAPLLTGVLCTPNQACDKCAPQIPPGVLAECVAGHCAVVLVN